MKSRFLTVRDDFFHRGYATIRFQSGFLGEGSSPFTRTKTQGVCKSVPLVFWSGEKLAEAFRRSSALYFLLCDDAAGQRLAGCEANDGRCPSRQTCRFASRNRFNLSFYPHQSAVPTANSRCQYCRICLFSLRRYNLANTNFESLAYKQLLSL